MSRKITTMEEFFEKEDPLNNPDYGSGNIDHWYFDKEDMILFAKRYAKAKLEEAAERATITVHGHNGIFRSKGQLKYSAYAGDHIEINKLSITETPLD